MKERLHQNNQLQIDQIDLEDEVDENKHHSSKKYTINETQNFQSKQNDQPHQGIETFANTEIIKINPTNKARDLRHDQQTYENEPPIFFKQESKNFMIESNQIQTQGEKFEGVSPLKQRKPRRKRQNSPVKKKKKIDQNLIQKEDFLIKTTLSTDSNSKNHQKSSSWLEFQDSQRHFSSKNQEKVKQPAFNFNSEEKIEGYKGQNSKEESESQNLHEYQSCQHLIGDVGIDSQYFEDSEQEELIYENGTSFEEQKEMANSNSFAPKKDHFDKSVKILKELPRQLLVETTFEALAMNPIPKGLKMVCNFVIESRYFGMSKQFNLVMNQTGKVLLSAKKEHFNFSHSEFNISMNENFISKRKGNSQLVGRLISNFSGTTYQLFRSIVSRHQNKGSQLNQQEVEQVSQVQDSYEEDLAAMIKFQSNLWGSSGIRKMQISKLDKSKLTKKDVTIGTNLLDVIERMEVSKQIKIQTTSPAYNKNTKRYSLNFGNKVKKPSSKNIILHWCQQNDMSEQNTKKQVKTFDSKQKKSQKTVSDSTSSKSNNERKFQSQQNGDKQTRQCLLIAKQSQTNFLVEISHPLSLFQAFGACLSNNDTKLLVN